MRSFNVVLVVVNMLPPPRPTRIENPGVAGLLGLIVETSKARFASAAIGFGGGGGSGIAQAVAGVAFVKSNFIAAPCVQVPLIEVASLPSLPSRVPPIAGTVIFRVDP